MPPSGALERERYGDSGASSSLYHTISYNSRLQPTSIALGTTAGGRDKLNLAYEYGTQGEGGLPAGGSINRNSNNDNVARITNTPTSGGPSFEQEFAYDALNRLSTAKEYQIPVGGGGGCGQIGELTAPTLTSATPGTGQVTLQWSDPNANECSFVIKKATALAGPYTSAGSVGANVLTYTVGGLSPGTYWFVVVAHNDTGDSAASNALSAPVSPSTPCATVPASLTATNVNGVQVSLTWPDAPNETGYRIEKWDETNSQPYTLVTTTAANATSFTDTNVVPFTTYRYRIESLPECVPQVWVESNDVTTTPADDAIKVDGVNDYGSPDASGAVTGLNVTGNITVEAWVVFADKDVTDVIVSKHKQNTAEGGYVLAVTNTNQLTFATYTAAGAAAAAVQSAGTVPYKQWCHVAGVYDGTNIRVFVNGVMTASAVGSGKGAATSASALQLGRALKSDGTGTKYLKGKIDELRISTNARYTAAFTPTNKNFTTDSNTKGLWKFNSTSGTTAGDASANGYTANLYNGVLWRAGVTTNYIDKARRRRPTPLSGDATEGANAAGGGETGSQLQVGASAEKLDATTEWTQTYSYDQWGNMQYSGDLSHNLAIDQSKNRVTSVDGNACTYDAAGNLWTETVAGRLQTYLYDAQNRMYQSVISGTGGGTVTFVYDGMGRRVKKTVGSTVTRYVYNASGQLVAEFTGTTRTKEYVYGPSGLLAVVENPGAGETVEYTTADHLGTPRVITSGTGTVGMVLGRHDYLPFGSEVPLGTRDRTTTNGYPTPTESINQRFTSKERDTETNLDFFGARYYSNSQGRFSSVDPQNVGASADDPQTWNGYSYARTNPLMYVDPDGLAIQVTDANGNKTIITDAQANKTLFNKKYISEMGYTVANGKVFNEKGEQIGTYRRVSFDEWTDQANQAIFGVVARADAMETAVNTFAAINVAVPAAIVGSGALAAEGLGELGISGAQFASKEAARQGLLQMGLSQAQAAAARSAISRATSTSTIEIIKDGSSVIIRISRPGANGWQVIESVINSAGGKTVIQKAFDALGRLVHFDPKTP